ncbi:MAG: putative sulfate exporter family transporter [Flavobacteriales bacterium]|nr:MAG: putative sulfate exporter family transporter [Flavobacteriales bacterium]
MSEKINFKHFIFFSLAILSLFHFVSPAMALILGILFINILPINTDFSSQYTKKILQYSIIGLGFGMNIKTAIKAGSEGFAFTIGSIIAVFSLGFILGKILKIDTKISQLISTGTAICGGSAIAAVSPIIGAKNSQNSVALGVVFLLNAIALFIFPSIGHYFNLTQNQFGIWSAIAIHDTSSVVGAASKYGNEALQIATTVKLARALWIIPIALIFSAVYKNGNKVKFPIFILLFIVAILLHSYIPKIDIIAPYIFKASKTGLKLALFLIGTGLPFKKFVSIGGKSIILGIILWLFISLSSLFVILNFVN